MLISYFHRTWGINVLILIIIVGSSTLQATSAILNSFMLNSLIQRDLHQFIFYTVLLLACWLGFTGCIFCQYYLYGVATQRMSLLLRQDIARSLQGRSYAAFHKQESDTYASWLMNDVALIEEQGFANVYKVAEMAAATIISIGALFTYHWSLIVLTLVLSLLTAFLPQVVHKKLQVVNLQVTQRNEVFLNGVSDVLKGFDTLLAFQRTQRLMQSVTRYGQKIAACKVEQKKIATEATALGVAANITSQLLTSGWTGVLVFEHITSTGAILSTGSLASNVYNSLANLGPTLNAVRAVAPLLKKYDLAFPAPAAADSLSATPVTGFDLTAQHLSYTFGEKSGLAPLSFQLPFPTKAAVIGDSGTGKSTLLNILAGKLADYGGSVTIGGCELRTVPEAALRQALLYVDQIPYIFNSTIRDNLTLGDDFPAAAIWQALTASDLADFVHQQPQGLDTPVGEKGRLFSGGQRQRLALARGLLRHKKILLIDEGTNSLSKASALAVEDNFLAQPDMTVLFVTHQLHAENKERFDQIISL
ncbi:ATP-binding cassette domain-containing protein [Schleiferilactobacillus harbinensis]|uniref:ATP-binding cassette domain-containing protein n=1 Tax=Schleiferilactobacillus harbinensis TaxID=304207 RepID=UPI0039E73E1B